MVILTSYVDLYDVSMIKENVNSLLVIITAISQIQLDFVFPLQEYEYKKGGDGNAPNVDDFGITETKPNHFYVSSWV